jgi:hypothetical protein
MRESTDSGLSAIIFDPVFTAEVLNLFQVESLQLSEYLQVNSSQGLTERWSMKRPREF